MGVEFEVKFQATPEILESLRREIPGQEAVFQMETTYYDTPSGAFSARHCTLRRRFENGRSICTLKTPAKGLGRREWETECNTIEEAIKELCKPEENKELLALTAEGLIPVCGAKFTRVAKTVELGNGTAELALDQGVLMGGGRQIPLCEVEVEQKTCGEKECLAYAGVLAARYGLKQESKSKFFRAQALYKGE